MKLKNKLLVKIVDPTLKAHMAIARIRFIRDTCQAHNWKIVDIAKVLGIHRSGLYHLIKTNPELNRAWKAARGKTPNSHTPVSGEVSGGRSQHRERSRV